jgi:hypothetical protein
MSSAAGWPDGAVLGAVESDWASGLGPVPYNAMELVRLRDWPADAGSMRSAPKLRKVPSRVRDATT